MFKYFPDYTREEVNSSVESVIKELLDNEVIELIPHLAKTRVIPKIKFAPGILNSVYIRLTDSCNNFCEHCSVDAKISKKINRLNKEILFQTIDQIHDMIVPVIAFTGGEATLLNDLEEIIAYTSDNHITPSLLTNGLLITPQKAKRLVKNGLSSVNISIDGCTASTHDRFRGVRGSFDKAVEAIKLFKSLGIFTETSTIIHEKNCEEFQDIIALLRSLGVDNMKVSPIIPSERGKKCNYEKSFDLYKKHIDLIESLSNSETLSNKDLINDPNKDEILRCDAGKGVLAISHNGDVLPCNNFDSIILGNILQTPLYDIYCNSAKLQPFKDKINLKGSVCSSCKLLDSCSGGCAVVAESYSGDYKQCDITRKVLVEAALKRENISNQAG